MPNPGPLPQTLLPPRRHKQAPACKWVALVIGTERGGGLGAVERMNDEFSARLGAAALEAVRWQLERIGFKWCNIEGRRQPGDPPISEIEREKVGLRGGSRRGGALPGWGARCRAWGWGSGHGAARQMQGGQCAGCCVWLYAALRRATLCCTCLAGLHPRALLSARSPSTPLPLHP